MYGQREILSFFLKGGLLRCFYFKKKKMSRGNGYFVREIGLGFLCFPRFLFVSFPPCKIFSPDQFFSPTFVYSWMFTYIKKSLRMLFKEILQ